MAEVLEKEKSTQVQLICWKENDTVKQYFNQNKVRNFFNPYFKTKEGFQKLVQDVSTTYYKNKDLRKCKKEQILQSVVDCLNLGLSLDKREHAYLVPRPYKNKQTKAIIGYSATLQIGWRGYIYKISQQYPDFNIDEIKFVRTTDEFSVETVNGSRCINHKIADPFDNNEQNIRGIYCTASYTKGTRICEIAEFMSLAEITKIKSKSTMGNYIWKDWYEAMAKKSIIRKLCKINFASITKKMDDFDNQFFNLNKKLPKSAGLEDANE